MKRSDQVVVTETAVVILSRGTFLTSIPLRHWTTTDGSTWSSRQRSAHEIDWLITRLTNALQNPSSDSVMKRVLSVMSQEPPSLPLRMARNHDSLDTKQPAKPTRRPAKRAPVARYMHGITRQMPLAKKHLLSFA